MIRGALVSDPIRKLNESILDCHVRLKVEKPRGLGDIGIAMPDVSRAELIDYVRYDGQTQIGGQRFGYIQDGARPARANVDHLAGCAVGLQRQKVSSGDIRNMDEIATLAAVLEYDWGLTVEQAGAKDGSDSRVGIRKCLAWPVDVEVSECGGRNPVGLSHRQAH